MRYARFGWSGSRGAGVAAGFLAVAMLLWDVVIIGSMALFFRKARWAKAAGLLWLVLGGAILLPLFAAVRE